MRILLSNDDGFDSVGIKSLAKVLAKEHEVIIAAPARQQSGMAHAISVHKPIEVIRSAMHDVGVSEVWIIDGTPADCVKMYLESIGADKKVDLVISGINEGANLGTDVIYSGTVGAAVEGYLHGISSIAVSLDIDSSLSYSRTAELLAAQVPVFFEESSLFFLNVNFPKELFEDKPNFVYTTVGHRDYANAFHKYEEDGKTYYVMEGEIYDGENSEISDIYAADHGCIAVTPLQTDMTDFFALEKRLTVD